MAIAYNTSIVRSGLVLHLDAANRKSYPGTGTAWTDLTGTGNNGTLVNGVGYSSGNNGSLVFDGVDDRGNFTNPVNSASPQSYEVWVKGTPSGTATNGFGYILHNNSASNAANTSYLVMGYAGTGTALQQNAIFAAIGGTLWNQSGTGVLADANITRQIVLTWDGSTQIVYVDGVARVSNPYTGTPTNVSTTTSFGDYNLSTYRPIVGNLYSIRVYNRALSASEVQQNFNALRGRYGI